MWNTLSELQSVLCIYTLLKSLVQPKGHRKKTLNKYIYNQLDKYLCHPAGIVDGFIVDNHLGSCVVITNNCL